MNFGDYRTLTCSGRRSEDENATVGDSAHRPTKGAEGVMCGQRCQLFAECSSPPVDDQTAEGRACVSPIKEAEAQWS